MKSQRQFDLNGSVFTWIDLIDPTEANLKSLAKEYQLDRHAVMDCMDPEHLPKFEKSNNVSFLILRYFDRECPSTADSVQELTRKLAIFFCKDFLITIHRKDSVFMKELRSHWDHAPCELNSELPVNLFYDILESAIQTYHVLLDEASEELEKIEVGVFEAVGGQPFELEKGYYLKRRASVFKRILRSTEEIIPKLAQSGMSHAHTSDVKDNLDKLHFYAEELNDNVASLLNLYLSLASAKTNEASHRTNEVMRVLTVVSLFFLPLNFVAGIYGMNFENMPELKWEHGYHLAIALMMGIGLALFKWFQQKGWLKETAEMTYHLTSAKNKKLFENSHSKK